MTLYASLSGIPVTRAELTVPFSGPWHADVILDRAVGPTPAGLQSLSLAGSLWTCSSIRAIDFSGERGFRLVGGGGGWRRTVPAREYASPAGVPTQVICNDVSAIVGETPPVVDASQPAIIGQYWCRQAGLASLVLALLFGAAWWMDPNGTVQTAPRVATPIGSPFQVLTVRPDLGLYEVSTEFPGDWMPGRTFVGPTASATISRVVHRLERGSLRTEVLAFP